MAWYDYIPSPALQIGNALSGGTPFGISSKTLLGGLNASTNPADYAKGTQFADRDQIMGAITPGMATNRVAPQTQMGGPFRNAQLGQIQQLQGIASGQQQGAGELAVQRQAARAIGQQQALARSQRGGNAALAYRGAAGNSANISLGAQGQAQQAALSDQQSAQQTLTGALGQGRGQDQQVQLANMDAQLKQSGMDDATRLSYLQQLTGMDQSQLQAQLAAMAAANGKQGLLGPALAQGGQMMGQMAMMSDERVKEEISDARHEVDDMLDALLPKAYVYKDQSKHGVGRRVGIMAQDLRKSKAGADVTMDTEDGIALDVNKAISAALASSARLNERVRKLERKKAA